MAQSKHTPGTSSLNINLLPDGLVPPEQRQLLTQLFEESDQLLFFERDELWVDRGTLVRIVRSDGFPPELREIALVETAKHLGRRIRVPGTKAVRVSWREGATKYGLPYAPASPTELRALGVTEETTSEDLADLLRTQFPALPSFWTESGPAEVREAVMTSFLANRTVWDCLVANLGWWAALVLIGSHIIFFGALGAGWQVALVLAAVYSGVATLWIVLNCIANVYFIAFR